MRLNDLKPSPGARRAGRRVGRGHGSGSGKTCGRGQKGQKSRSGGGVPAGFEGGQMPLQRRLPKLGFTSRKAPFNDEVKVGSLARLDGGEVNPERLRAAGLVKRRAKRIKVIAGGEPGRAFTLTGVRATAGARTAIEAAGGTVND
ncbi:MAG: 50S ribosomal protein L15 [Immundisolibacterales bacterium]|nr:50S ribosomal protein L15 [Immundisolibacterales bacterium]